MKVLDKLCTDLETYGYRTMVVKRWQQYWNILTVYVGALIPAAIVAVTLMRQMPSRQIICDIAFIILCIMTLLYITVKMRPDTTYILILLLAMCISPVVPILLTTRESVSLPVTIIGESLYFLAFFAWLIAILSETALYGILWMYTCIRRKV